MVRAGISVSSACNYNIKLGEFRVVNYSIKWLNSEHVYCNRRRPLEKLDNICHVRDTLKATRQLSDILLF